MIEHAQLTRLPGQAGLIVHAQEAARAGVTGQPISFFVNQMLLDCYEFITFAEREQTLR